MRLNGPQSEGTKRNFDENVEKVKSSFNLCMKTIRKDSKRESHKFIRLPFGGDNWSFNKNRPSFDLMDQ